jgi:anti-anti-sigma factor
LNLMELDGGQPARSEQAHHHANGYSLSHLESAGDGVILAVGGEIDIANADEFSDQVRGLMDGAEGEIVLGFQDCGFIDSTGIRALIMLARELRTRGQTLVIAGLNGGPRRVFEIAGLLDRRDFEIRNAGPDMEREVAEA